MSGNIYFSYQITFSIHKLRQEASGFNLVKRVHIITVNFFFYLLSLQLNSFNCSKSLSVTSAILGKTFDMANTSVNASTNSNAP